MIDALPLIVFAFAVGFVLGLTVNAWSRRHIDRILERYEEPTWRCETAPFDQDDPGPYDGPDRRHGW